MREWVFLENVGRNIEVLFPVGEDRYVERAGTLIALYDGVVHLREDDEDNHYVEAERIVAVTVEREEEE